MKTQSIIYSCRHTGRLEMTGGSHWTLHWIHEYLSNLSISTTTCSLMKEKHLDIHSIPLCPRSKLHSGTHKHWQSPFSWLQALHGLLSRWVVSHLSRRHRRQLPHRSLPQSAGCAWSRAVRAFVRRSCREPYSGPSWEVAYYCESSCSPLSPPSPSNWPAPSAAQPGN